MRARTGAWRRAGRAHTLGGSFASQNKPRHPKHPVRARFSGLLPSPSAAPPRRLRAPKGVNKADPKPFLGVRHASQAAQAPLRPAGAHSAPDMCPARRAPSPRGRDGGNRAAVLAALAALLLVHGGNAQDGVAMKTAIDVNTGEEGSSLGPEDGER